MYVKSGFRNLHKSVSVLLSCSVSFTFVSPDLVRVYKIVRVSLSPPNLSFLVDYKMSVRTSSPTAERRISLGIRLTVVLFTFLPTRPFSRTSFLGNRKARRGWKTLKRG